MSSQTNTYLLWGAVFPYDDNLVDDVEPFTDNPFQEDSINPRHGVTVLFDGCDGIFIAVGHVWKRSPVNEPFSAAVHTLPEPAPEWAPNIVWAVHELGLQNADGGMFRWHVITHVR